MASVYYNESTKERTLQLSEICISKGECLMAINRRSISNQSYRAPDFLVFDNSELTEIQKTVTCKEGDIGKQCRDGNAGITCIANTGVKCSGNGGIGIACSGSSISVVCVQSNHPNSCRKSTGTSDSGEEEI